MRDVGMSLIVLGSPSQHDGGSFGLMMRDYETLVIEKKWLGWQIDFTLISILTRTLLCWCYWSSAHSLVADDLDSNLYWNG